ncbi:MAG TPA: hypothetical protein VE913_11630, partial [Longimicrobium sp.]|nr:hypothetical protein [Longimicrobium sp.]
YKVEDSSIRHLGPTAQDFHRAFGLGGSELSIGTVDADGVALAGVQALDRRTTEQSAEIAKLRSELAASRAENRALSERLARLEALIARP